MLEVALQIQRDDFALKAEFSAQPGTITALIGPSRAGKTTLLHGIAGFVPEAKGTVSVGGADVGNLPAAARPISILFQDHSLFPHMTVHENISLGLRTDLRLNRQQRDTVADLMERIGLGGLGKRKPKELSGGQQSRVALARALPLDRAVLLLDEPFAAPGPALRSELAAPSKKKARRRARPFR